MKPEASSTTKATDKQLAKVQTLLLDSLAPLTMLLEAHHRGDESDPKDVVRAVKVAVELIANANAHMSNLRRVKVIGDINKALLPLVGDDTNFVEAPPLLFGTEFAQKGKEMVDQVKAMRSTFTSKPERRPPFFRNGPPGNRGGLQSQVRKGRSPKFPLWSRKTIPGRERNLPEQPQEQNTELERVHVCLPPFPKDVLSNQIACLGIVPVHPAAGRLRDHRNTWKVLTRDPWVLDTIKGHLIDFTSKPCQDVVPHTPHYTADQDHLIK